MKRYLRILLELLGPPAIGALSLTFAHGIRDEHSYFNFANLIFTFILAYFFAGIPSLIYTATMEQAIARGLQPKTWSCVGLSSVLGLLAGVALGLLFHYAATTPLFTEASNELRHMQWLADMVLAGLWTGFVMGLLLKAFAHWSDRKNPPPPALPPAKSL